VGGGRELKGARVREGKEWIVNHGRECFSYVIFYWGLEYDVLLKAGERS